MKLVGSTSVKYIRVKDTGKMSVGERRVLAKLTNSKLQMLFVEIVENAWIQNYHCAIQFDCGNSKLQKIPAE